jgi:serine/threonine protein kinase
MTPNRDSDRLDETRSFQVLAPGTMISHYKIIEKLGEGGMGVVYKAEDTKLKRHIALKFLLPELTRDSDARERFMFEARAASGLDHPNICTIHEVDETENGHIFISMACCEGETLKQKIARGLVKFEDAIEITVQASKGLARAHDRRIAHRDVKPANIMITKDGHVLIMDFGLAKLSGQIGVTKAGTTVGTVAYMSPEQARGEDVDHRTDIWSLGVVLYEMLTGRLPFRGDHEQAVIYAIMNEAPAPIGALRTDLPAELERAVNKALEKDREQRYQSVDMFAEEIKGSLEAGSRPPDEAKSIVVLPFEDISPGKDNEYFSDGLTEEIITDLSRIHALRVISRTSAMQLKGTDKDVRAIGRELNVQYVLEGSVRKAGDNLRITAQLIDAVNDTHLWAQKYRGTLEDIFDIQESVSRSIAAAIRIKLSPEESKMIGEHLIDNAQAYECHLKARHEIYKFTADALGRALEYLQEALSIAGPNIRIYSALGHVYYQFWNAGVRVDEECLIKAREYADKVFELEPDSPHGHLILALLQVTGGTLKESVRHFKKILATEPNDPDVLAWAAVLYALLGQRTIVETLVKRLSETDPLHPFVYCMPGILNLFVGEFESAVETFKQACQTHGESLLLQMWYAFALAYVGHFDEAASVIDRLARDNEASMLVKTCVLLKYAVQGRKQDVLKSIGLDLKRWAEKDFNFSLWVAECCAMVGENERALQWLENSVDHGFVNYPFLNEYDPLLENIRGEDRFKKLMERVKREWEHFEV